MMTKKESQLLDLFGKMTTPSSSYHPCDIKRWGDFVFCVYKNMKRRKPIARPTQNEMMNVLGKYHFNGTHVQHLYDMLTDDLIIVSRCWWRR